MYLEHEFIYGIHMLAFCLQEVLRIWDWLRTIHCPEVKFERPSVVQIGKYFLFFFWVGPAHKLFAVKKNFLSVDNGPLISYV